MLFLAKISQNIFIVFFILFSWSCLPGSKSNTTSTSTDWALRSAEKQALVLQAYSGALGYLEQALSDERWTATSGLKQKNFTKQKAAIIVDIDETILDTSAFQMSLQKSGRVFSEDLWDQWINKREGKSFGAARNLLNIAHKKGVAIFYITNRRCKKRDKSMDPCPQEEDTVINLQQEGFISVTADSVMMRDENSEWGSDKDSRRKVIEDKYRVIFYIGDDLGDFIEGVRNMSFEERNNSVLQYKEFWGKQWIILPNPVYGSWTQVNN